MWWWVSSISWREELLVRRQRSTQVQWRHQLIEIPQLLASPAQVRTSYLQSWTRCCIQVKGWNRSWWQILPWERLQLYVFQLAIGPSLATTRRAGFLYDSAIGNKRCFVWVNRRPSYLFTAITIFRHHRAPYIATIWAHMQLKLLNKNKMKMIDVIERGDK